VAQQAWSLPTPWSAQDIGNPTIAGSATFDQGAFTVTAGGTDIWGQADQFTFVYQQVTGDVEVIARVDSITAAHAWSKSGVMIRSSLTSTRRMVSPLSRPAGASPISVVRPMAA